MGRGAYTYWSTTCAAGINEQDDLARRHQCREALNVWAPAGRIEARPGYTGVTWVGAVSPVSSDMSAVLAEEDVSTGNFNSASTGSSLEITFRQAQGSTYAAGDRWYVGFTNTISPSAINGLRINLMGANTSTVKFKAEYWNGTSWNHLHVVESNEGASFTDKNTRASLHLGKTGTNSFIFLGPNDWTAKEVDGENKLWIRFTLFESDTDDLLDAGVILDNHIVAPGGNVFPGYYTTGSNLADLRGLFVAQFPTTKRYLAVSRSQGNSRVYFHNAASLNRDDWFYSNFTEKGGVADEPASVAVVPEFGDAYVSYSNMVAHLVPFPSSTESIVAKVEDREYLVGDAEENALAYFDKNLVAQEEKWPRAKYIMFFKGILWGANMDDNPFMVRWSGPVPYHRVWPSAQYESLMEDDNSPIRALSSLGEHPIIFKNDSIWTMVYVGKDSDNLTVWSPNRVVAGTGCVSNSSVAQIRGRLIFLAEDGIYAFNGTPNIEKVTEDKTTGADRIRDIIGRITPGRRAFANAVHWKARSCYLLAVSLDGSDVNNHVIVWDYKNDSWWLWDNIEAQYWLRDETAGDNEVLYFGDSTGRLYLFGKGKTDYGTAITGHVVTQRFNYEQYQKMTPRVVRLSSASDSRSLSVEVRANDNDIDPITGTVSFTDVKENDWTDFEWDGASDNWSGRRARKKNLFVRKGLTCDWAQVKVSHSTKDQKFQLDQIAVGMVKHGKR